MSKISIRLAAICIMLSFAACTKDDYYDNYNDVEDTERKGYLAEVTDTTVFYSVAEFEDYIESTITEIGNANTRAIFTKLVGYNEFRNLEKKMMEEQGVQNKNELDLRFEKYNFRYRSVAADGEPVYLSGCAIFPNSSKSAIPHEIEDVTIFQPYWMTNDECVSIKGSPVMMRTAFNQMVVIPDYQGYGITFGTMKHPFTEYRALARQAVDCELAALELIGETGARLNPNYVTYNMGASKGAGAAMELARYLETEANRKVADKVRLSSSYCCTGAYDLLNLLYSYNNLGGNTEYWMATMLASSAFYSNPAKFNGYSIEDFFSEEFLKARLYEGEREYTLVEIIEDKRASAFRLGEIFKALGLDGIDRIYNPEFFYEDGTFNFDNPLLRAFAEVLVANNPTRNWDPQTPVLMEYTNADNRVEVAVSKASYEELRKNQDGTTNENVRENVYSLVNHDTMTAIGIARMMIMKDPSSKVKLNY